MFAGNKELLKLIPESAELTLAKLARKGWAMSDTCTPARAFHQAFKKLITVFALSKEISKEEIQVFDADCWHHLRNIWFGRVTLELGKWLQNVLSDDFKHVHYSLRLTTNVVMILRAVDKYFQGTTANYAKGKGSMFFNYTRCFHPTVYMYIITQACGGARQYVGIEGTCSVLMNIPIIWSF